MIQWLKRWRWRKPLQNCNFDTARMLLATQYQDTVLQTDLGTRLDRFLAEPCFDTAADLLDLAPDLISYFENSKPGGEMNLLFKR